jgi:peptide deformylase
MLKIHLINDDPILREDLSSIVTDAKSLKPYHSELLKLCEEMKAAGVAANQLGIRENFFFLSDKAKIPTRVPGAYAAHICANPTWTAMPDSTISDGVEGCLSLPGRQFVVPRYTVIDAEWDNVMGHPRVKRKLRGWAARVFQHEHDHLRGVTLLESGKEVK